MKGFKKIEPFEEHEEIVFEIYFSKFFPVNQLVKKGIMSRTAYGITLTREFKDKIIQVMEKLQLDKNVILKFKMRKYLEIDLEKLWNSIVCAVSEINGCKYQIKGGEVFVPLKKAPIIEAEASAVYCWFRHVRRVLEKSDDNHIRTLGDYV